ncbi:hypothetical protein DFH08DRAFT_384306 [Mycena albidolilacea]|uniref:Uncharacterized protein n=1 Tax=Mycena albidolilacea TaxID=1033008 RepID=A0AAD6ZG34_9AGAR|nr:hypothetical protein DFH08DRAFT_384306 [Mycena albidolilacea]
MRERRSRKDKRARALYGRWSGWYSRPSSLCRPHTGGMQKKWVSISTSRARTPRAFAHLRLRPSPRLGHCRDWARPRPSQRRIHRLSTPRHRRPSHPRPPRPHTRRGLPLPHPPRRPRSSPSVSRAWACRCLAPKHRSPTRAGARSSARRAAERVRGSGGWDMAEAREGYVYGYVGWVHGGWVWVWVCKRWWERGHGILWRRYQRVCGRRHEQQRGCVAASGIGSASTSRRTKSSSLRVGGMSCRTVRHMVRAGRRRMTMWMSLAIQMSIIPHAQGSFTRQHAAAR